MMSNLPPSSGQTTLGPRPPRQVSDRARVLFVCRQRLSAETLRFALRQTEMEVEIASHAEAEQAVRSEPRPNLVVIDVEMTGTGLDLARRLLRLDPSVKLVALLSSLSPKMIDAMSEAGFCGFITKDTPLSTFVHGLRHCLAGRPFRLPSSRPRVRRRPLTALLVDQLTPREREVVAILVEGSGNEEISARLQISPNTVRTHIQSVLSKLQLHSRVEIAAWAYRNGLVGPRPGGDRARAPAGSPIPS